MGQALAQAVTKYKIQNSKYNCSGVDNGGSGGHGGERDILDGYCIMVLYVGGWMGHQVM